MSLTVSDNSQSTNPAPEGLHPMVCVDAVDLGILDTSFGKKHKGALVFEIDKVNPETGKRFEVWKRYTMSLNEKASLRKDLETWRGARFTKEETQGFDLERVIGAPGQVQLVHNASDDGRVFANIQVIIPLSPGMVPMKPSPDYVRVINRPKDGQSSAGSQQAAPANGHNGQKRATPPPAQSAPPPQQPAAAPSGPAPF